MKFDRGELVDNSISVDHPLERRRVMVALRQLESLDGGQA